MTHPKIMLVHPPVAKPCEPPAGIARLAGALRAHDIDCTIIDANLEGLHHLLGKIKAPKDTWSKRAYRHVEKHLTSLRTHGIYKSVDKYRRAVADINRLLSLAGKSSGIRVNLANYEDHQMTPVRSADLVMAAEYPERNPYFKYFQQRIQPVMDAGGYCAIGISINFLSQALCAFALIGMLKQTKPDVKIIIGGGLISSWLNRPNWRQPFTRWVDEMVSGPGETALINAAGKQVRSGCHRPDYDDLSQLPYLSPGFVLPFSSASGCWWKRCSFCPEKTEKSPYRPLPHSVALDQIKGLTMATRPSIIHFLDNALSPALLRRLASDPPGVPWYGFVRIGQPLDDPGFCRDLAQAGCTMLKIGLESGDPTVLEALKKGIRLETASKVLKNLQRAGIATYVYLLFGTPAENKQAAEKTMSFVVDHHGCIDFLNLAVFNLPIGSSEMNALRVKDFYTGDLQLYRDFEHPQNWSRPAVRHFLEKRFKKHPAIQPIIRRDPPIFTSNHAAFFSPSEIGRSIGNKLDRSSNK